MRYSQFWSVLYGYGAGQQLGDLAIVQDAVGMAETAMILAGLKTSSKWFPAKDCSIADGYFNVGSSICAMVAPSLVGGLGDYDS